MPEVWFTAASMQARMAGAQASEEEGSPDGAEGEEEGGSPAKAKPLKKAILTYPGNKAAPGKARDMSGKVMLPDLLWDMECAQPCNRIRSVLWPKRAACHG